MSAIQVRYDSQFKTWQDVVDYAKKNPGKLKWGIMGALSVDDLASSAIIQQAGIDVKLVPYDSGGEGHAALLGGHVDLLFEEPGVVTQLIQAKKMRPILMLTESRIGMFPDVVCLADMGYKNVPKLWRGFFVKAGTPADRVKTLEKAMTESMRSSVYVAYEKDSLLNLYPGGFQGSEAFAASLEEELKVYKEVMAKLGYLKK